MKKILYTSLVVEIECYGTKANIISRPEFMEENFSDGKDV
jgi:hypothetical protein